MKMLRLSQFVAGPMLMLLMATPALAAPLNPSQLPADAKWLIHVDLDALSETPLAQQARQNRPGIVGQVRQWIQGRYGIDPREDLHSLTAFSNTYEAHSGTVILQANYDQQKVANELQNQPGVQTTKWQNHTLYIFNDAAGQERQQANQGQQQGQNRDAAAQSNRGNQSGQRQGRQKHFALVLLNGETMVAASSPERVQAAVQLLQGNSDTLQQKSPLIADAPQGTIAYGAAVDLSSIERREGFFPVLRQMDRIVWYIGQENGEVFDNLTINAQSEEVAKQLKTALEGMVAFGKVWAADSQSLTKLAEETQVSQDGKTVTRQWRGSNQVVLEAIGELGARLQQRVEPVLR